MKYAEYQRCIRAARPAAFVAAGIRWWKICAFVSGSAQNVTRFMTGIRMQVLTYWKKDCRCSLHKDKKLYRRAYGNRINIACGHCVRHCSTVRYSSMQWWKKQESPCFSCGECQIRSVSCMWCMWNRLRYILQNVPSIFHRGQCFLPMRCAWFCGWPHPFEATAQMELQMKFYSMYFRRAYWCCFYVF